MAIFPSTAIPSGAAAGFTIPYSCRFNDDDTAYLSRTPASAGNRRTFTWSAWFKHGAMDGSFTFISAADDNFHWKYSTDGAGQARGLRYEHSADGAITAVGFSRDPSAWYHIMWVVDTTDTSPASNKKKMYINGVRVDDTSGGSYGDNNREQSFNNNTVQYIGSNTTPGGSLFEGYLAEVHMIDGTALTPSSFGETEDYGEWKPKAYDTADGAYGTCGYYLDFADSAALGNDVSGNDNDWTVTNLDAADQMLDTPTNNFCTMNPLSSKRLPTISEGNTKTISGGTASCISGTLGASSGKWYWEYQCTDAGDDQWIGAIIPHSITGAFNIDDTQSYKNPDVWSYSAIDGEKCNGAGLYNGTSYGTTWSSGTSHLIGVALDLDNNKIYWSYNGTWQDSGDPAAGTDFAFDNLREGYYVPSHTGTDAGGIYNFGQDSSFAGVNTAQGNQDGNGIGDFYYTPPTGFLALCTSNLPDVDIIPSEHFNTILFDDGAGAKTGVGFQPDFVWLKSRGSTYKHKWTDAVRGVTKAVSCNLDGVEATADVTGLTAFGADGFTVGANTNYSDTTGDGMVAWNWKANGAGSANTDGNMAETVTVSANTDAGFSIVTYTGDGAAATVGHGLSKAPELILVKDRDAAEDWMVYYNAGGAMDETYYLNLNDDGAISPTAENWNDTEAAADVFTIGDGASVNTDDDEYVAYCFHSVDGYSKVGYYLGNGNADGTFVYTGFRPAFILLKHAKTAMNWVMYDNKRDIYNFATTVLRPDDQLTEATGHDLDIVSNGFKLRDAIADINHTNQTFIYLAIAETPFKYSNAK